MCHFRRRSVYPRYSCRSQQSLSGSRAGFDSGISLFRQRPTSGFRTARLDLGRVKDDAIFFFLIRFSGFRLTTAKEGWHRDVSRGRRPIFFFHPPVAETHQASAHHASRAMYSALIRPGHRFLRANYMFTTGPVIDQSARCLSRIVCANLSKIVVAKLQNDRIREHIAGSATALTEEIPSRLFIRDW